MKISRLMMAVSCLSLVAGAALAEPNLKLNDKGYFEAPGLNVTVFADIYPDGHQTGVTVIQHGVRVAANGDLRLEPSPGQWSPMPAGDGKPVVDAATNSVSQVLHYPDETKNRKGFNPIDYPDLNFSYHVRVTPLEGNAFRVSVDLDKPLPSTWEGKVGFNFELFPTDLFGKSWLMDQQSGIFPRQANGGMENDHGQTITAPLAEGKSLTVAPESPLQRMTIRSQTGELELIDGRGNFNNGWYIVREITKPGATKDAITWTITPNVDPDWRYTPVVQVSQVGYRPEQAKTIVIEQDKRDTQADPLVLYRMTANGREEVARYTPKPWGQFLRYNYLTADLSAVKDPGMYELEYRGDATGVFRISDDVYDRHVWQPTLEYFLPVQMCHMLVKEKYRTWHGLDHEDDVRMAPINFNHFDGYLQGGSTLTKYQPGEHVPGLNAGGWHDAGDYDLRVESQMGTVWLLAKMVEEFGLNYDATTIDEAKKVTEIHQPDGQNDALQQIEHGLLSVLGGYKALGRTYRGIIEPTLEQYTLLGDISTQTDNLDYDPALKPGERTARTSSIPDDRYVFTEDNPNRELTTAAQLATAARVLTPTNPKMAADALAAARDLYDKAYDRATDLQAKVFVLSELAQTTHDSAVMKRLIGLKPEIVAHIDQTGTVLASAMPLIRDKAFKHDVGEAVKTWQAKLTDEATKTPYGVPYVPYIWGAGWDIQRFGVDQYFVHKAWPQYTPDTLQMEALNFVLGVHPGENTESFASGVGAKSATTAYGANRADWSYIPGGVISGTALIRPDLPELKKWPYFWQQTEYVMGGGETNYMFLVLAAAQKH
ncbi:glycoside hydrolase family 9 protein [Asticcacaulis taihuensis]|uniref:N-terminal ig-like domain of cellulase n=1 Tax=Asticcacaulis taihuensis TaxID=260084 RepID=A0A1G4QH57_9CAUL|nr:glycoside hydrolase family 9 protein [Asticcacaulis taihuensis]SCW43944.1 N-terminal ig-like domain of cellulase [Asticcacaulis taihuensis]